MAVLADLVRPAHTVMFLRHPYQRCAAPRTCTDFAAPDETANATTHSLPAAAASVGEDKREGGLSTTRSTGSSA